MMATLYPNGYARQRVTLAQLRAIHEPKMHPEFARRLFAWIESKGGTIGIGGGWRSTQPDRPGFAPDGRSFHQSQRFASGFVGYAAVDLVAVNGTGVHRAPTWAESADAPRFGLHTFIAGEPWHIQCVEMRGWQTWVNAGRPDPQPVPLPTDPPPIVPVPPRPSPPEPLQPPSEEDEMSPTVILTDPRLNGTFALCAGRWVPWLLDGKPENYYHLVPRITIDHPWTREQILHDQGPAAAQLWRERMAPA